MNTYCIKDYMKLAFDNLVLSDIALDHNTSDMKLILVYFSLAVFAISSAKYVASSKTQKYKVENGILYDADTMSNKKIHDYSVSE